MTERARKPQIARKGRRPHRARNARLISTGAAASLTLGVVAALAIGDAPTRRARRATRAG